MKVISSFPCLGKTTICNLNKERCFDRQFDIRRSVQSMGQIECLKFFDACADMILLQYKVDAYEIMFIDNDDRLIKRVANDPAIKKDMVLVFPNVNDRNIMEEYVIRTSGFYGAAWVNKNLKSELDALPARIKSFIDEGYDVRLTNLSQKYIHEVMNLPVGFITPGDEDRNSIF
ncbi:MAG: hypothetical protein K5668_04690 [Lachnospiraceae bacterium]|nr:hypothetical protein [Lachnospiraceae bacterium]